MQIVEMITRKDGSINLAVKIGKTEYVNPLADWVRLAEQIIEEAEAHLTPVAADGSKCRYCGNPMSKNEIRCKVCHP